MAWHDKKDIEGVPGLVIDGGGGRVVLEEVGRQAGRKSRRSINQQQVCVCDETVMGGGADYC